MDELTSRLSALGVGVPEILLPRKGIDLSKWAVIACDQFTQDRNYWEQVKKNTGASSPSSLNLVFPEVYLGDGGEEGRAGIIRNIRASMDLYMREGVFAPPKRGCVYVERSTPNHPKRRGILLLLDLEQYDWTPGSRPLIRSTEGTAPERLPPRMDIRRGAPLEIPHILILLDDENDSLIPSLGEIAMKNPPLYETPLMMNSGAVSGWAVDSKEALAVLAQGLETLLEKSITRYKDSSRAADSSPDKPFLFAVGDGNHSLATAKAIWEEFKKSHSNGNQRGEVDLENHPARWALVEAENLYDPGISFEPIHRVLFGAEPPELMDILSALKDKKFRQDPSNKRVIRMENLSPAIATAGLQPLLDDFVKKKGCSIDYIHGEDEVLRITEDPSRRAVGLILPPVEKEGLFKTVARTGPLPRKSFSMGESEEKRFYLESRRLFG